MLWDQALNLGDLTLSPGRLCQNCAVGHPAGAAGLLGGVERAPTPLVAEALCGSGVRAKETHERRTGVFPSWGGAGNGGGEGTQIFSP